MLAYYLQKSKLQSQGSSLFTVFSQIYLHLYHTDKYSVN